MNSEKNTWSLNTEYLSVLQEYCKWIVTRIRWLLQKIYVIFLIVLKKLFLLVCLFNGNVFIKFMEKNKKDTGLKYYNTVRKKTTTLQEIKDTIHPTPLQYFCYIFNSAYIFVIVSILLIFWNCCDIIWKISFLKSILSHVESVLGASTTLHSAKFALFGEIIGQLPCLSCQRTLNSY